MLHLRMRQGRSRSIPNRYMNIAPTPMPATTHGSDASDEGKHNERRYDRKAFTQCCRFGMIPKKEWPRMAKLSRLGGVHSRGDY